MDTAYAARLEADAEAFREIKIMLEDVAALALAELSKGHSDGLAKSLRQVDDLVRDLFARVDRLASNPLPLPLQTLLAAGRKETAS